MKVALIVRMSLIDILTKVSWYFLIDFAIESPSPLRENQVPQTETEIAEFVKYQTKKMRLAKILNTKYQHDTKILIHRQKNHSRKIKEQIDNNSEVNVFLFKKKQLDSLKHFDNWASTGAVYKKAGDKITAMKSLANNCIKTGLVKSQNPAISTKMRKRISNLFYDKESAYISLIKNQISSMLTQPHTS